MRNIILFGIVVTSLYGRSLSAESLNDWLLAQVQKDEQRLIDAHSQTDGRSLELLRDSRTYIPFFLEAPGNHASDLAEYKQLFDAWGNGSAQGFLPGGYIFRLRFSDAPPLYAASAGSWDGKVWHSLDLNKDLIIESARVWSGSRNDFLYATTVAGVLPKMIVYDQHGEVKREEVFNVNDADFEQRLAAAELTYAGKGTPILEMLSLAEYLENPDASWREADLSGQFNFRNQQQRKAERERLESRPYLTRRGAIKVLKWKSSPQEPQQPSTSSGQMSVPQAPESIKSSKATQTTVEVSSPPPGWLVVVVVAVLGLLWVWLKKRK